MSTSLSPWLSVRSRPRISRREPVIAAATATGPTLIVVEDVHWVDPTSQELLESLVPRVRQLPVLLVLTYRPEYEPVWRDQAGVTGLELTRRAEKTWLAIPYGLAVVDDTAGDGQDEHGELHGQVRQADALAEIDTHVRRARD